MKFGPREQIIIAVVGLVVVLVAMGAFLIWPQWQQLGELDSKISAARSDVDSAKGLLAVRVQSKNRAAETDAKWLRLANLVPEGPDLPSLIVELQDTAFASGVQLITVTPAAPTANSSYYTIPMNMSVLGTWSDTVDFLQRVVKLNRGIRIVESSSVRTTNSEQQAKENVTLPDYSLVSTVLIQAYMIPAAPASATPAPVAPAP